LALVGPAVHDWGRQVLQRRGVAGIRVLAGMLHLSGRHPAPALDRACGQALTLDQFRLRAVRQLLATKLAQPELELQQDHPLRRDLADYAAVVQTLSATNPNHQPRD